MYYVTLRCNSKCVYCDIWSEADCKSSGDAAPLDVAANLPELRLLGVRYIDFTGGEPLLCERLPEILSLARGAGFQTGLVTNGLLYPRRARELAGKLSCLSFSLDGATAETHNAQRGIKGFHRVIESLEIAKRLKQPADVNCTVTNDNYQELPEIVRLAQEIKVPVYLNPAFSYFGNPQLNQEIAAELRRFAKEPFVIVNRAGLRLAEQGGNSTDAPACRAMDAVVAISWDNKLLLPCYHHQFRQIPIEGNLAELYRSPEVRALAENVGRWNFCEGCTIWCYLGPSFLQRLDRYFFLYTLSMLRGAREIYWRGRQQPDPGVWDTFRPTSAGRVSLPIIP